MTSETGGFATGRPEVYPTCCALPQRQAVLVMVLRYPRQITPLCDSASFSDTAFEVLDHADESDTKRGCPQPQQQRPRNIARVI